MTILRTFIVLVLSLLYLTTPAWTEDADHYNRDIVSVIDLIANPELYDDKKISVFGFAVFNFEGNSLYFSKEFTRVPPLGVSLIADKYDCQLNYTYVLVDGTFIISQGTNMVPQAGEIRDVTRIEKWEPSLPDELGKASCMPIKP